jgi:hypothetical protein
VQAIRYGRTLLGTSTITIEHAGIDIASPLVLYGSAGSAQAMALETMLARRPVAADGPVTAPGPDGLADRAPQATRRRPPPVLTVMTVLGLGVSIVLIGYGFLIAIPQLGGFGVIWTVLGIVIFAVNTIQLIRRGW